MRGFEKMNKTEYEYLPKKGRNMKSVKLLAIANSFSDDCMEHVYGILKSLGVENIELGNLYIGGCSLDQHCANLRGDLPNYEFRTNDSDVWENTLAYKMGDGIELKEWDFIFTQQRSGYSGLVETYDYLDEVLGYIKSKAKGNPKYGWQLTWAYAKDSTHEDFARYNNSQDEMYAAILNAVKTKILPRTELTISPSGTAIQNGRQVFGDVLHRDGFHLSFGLGRYIAGLCVVKALVGLDIDNVTFAPEGVSDEERKLAIAVANAACEKPFEVTTVTK